MSAKAFLDSNVLLYLFDSTAPSRRQTAESLIEDALSTGSACISYQVAQETLHVMTRKLGANQEVAGQFLSDVLKPLWDINPTAELFERALEIRTRYRFGFHDSLIVAAALGAGCSTLYSEDLQHGQRIGQLLVTNPFA